MSKEFKRNVCFTFFESYLEQAKAIMTQMGVEKAYGYLIAVIEYGLYQKESEDPVANMLMCGLKNTIDANQQKRAQGFTRENADQTEIILEYKKTHPEATQREIAEATKCSLGKVNKALASDSTSNRNPNPNGNASSCSNYNSVNVNANASPLERGVKKRKRWLDDLTDEELESIKDDYRRRISYLDTRERLDLDFNVTKETYKDAENVLKERREERKNQKIKESVESATDHDIDEISTLFHCEKDEVIDKLKMVGFEAGEVIKWISKFDGGNTYYDIYVKRSDSHYPTFDDFMKMIFMANPLE